MKSDRKVSREITCGLTWKLYLDSMSFLMMSRRSSYSDCRSLIHLAISPFQNSLISMVVSRLARAVNSLISCWFCKKNDGSIETDLEFFPKVLYLITLFSYSNPTDSLLNCA